MPKSPYSGGEEPMTLELDCWSDELSPAQLKAFEVAESEHLSIRNKLSDIVSTSGGENVFLGEVFSAYHVPGPAPGLENIAKPVAAVRKENRARVAAEEKLRRAAEAATRKREQEEEQQQQQQQEDDDDEYMPLQKRAQLAKGRPPSVQDNKKKLDVKTPLGRKPEHSPPTTVGGAFRPTENTSIGGLSVGDKRKEVVDLTKDDTVGGKVAADSKEITFNKLQGKTFPSLVVVARPSLKVKENINDRPALDAKVKGVLMHTATKFTEWLIQQGLVRSEQTCQIHSGQLKLGMYSDVSKFAYSGGYVWISTCCPTRFVSVFNGSLFEGAPHPPSTLLKLIYHWSCQTNVQNVVQWVKVDNLYVKGLYAWLRSVCTVALSQHMRQLGGPGRKIEVGVISLGTTSQDGQQRQVKVEVLGVLDFESKVVRLRAVEPLNDGERNYKKRFSKILEPLANWVHKDSLILTDLTVDKGTLHTMGYKHVQQMSVAASSASSKSSNANIMDYLRRIVPRMFQNTLSLLSRQIIQQFLDELVWRESYGTTPGTAFDNIVSHISEQTRLDAKESLVHRLNKVGANPFKSWAHLSVRMPAKKLRDDFFNSASRTSPADIPAPAAASTSSISSGGADSTPKRGRKRRDPCKKKNRSEHKCFILSFFFYYV